MYYTVLYNTILYNIILYCTILRNTILYCTILHYKFLNFENEWCQECNCQWLEWPCCWYTCWNWLDSKHNIHNFMFCWPCISIYYVLLTVHLHILRSVDRASPYIHLKKTQLYAKCIFSIFLKKPLHVSGVSIAHHQEVNHMNTPIGTPSQPWQKTVI